MLKRGDQGKFVKELQEKLLSLGYELPQFGADGDFGEETESAVSEFKQELIKLTEEEGVSSELHRLIDALVEASWKRPSAKPEFTAEEIEELVSSIYDAFHPLSYASRGKKNRYSESEEHVESLQTALKRLGFYHGKIDGLFGNGTRRSIQAAYPKGTEQFELELPASIEFLTVINDSSEIQKIKRRRKV